MVQLIEPKRIILTMFEAKLTKIIKEMKKYWRGVKNTVYMEPKSDDKSDVTKITQNLDTLSFKIGLQSFPDID